MRVVAYIRVSREEQARDGVSLDAQRSKAEQFARLHELDLVEVVADAGVSAKTLARPGLSRALRMLESGAVAGVIVAKLDRLTRSIRDWSDLIDRFFSEGAGKQLFSVGDSIDTRTAAGRLVLNVLMSVAQWERETIVERTIDAIRHKQKLGYRVGKVPFGFDLAPDGRLVVNGREQEAREMILRLRGQGWSFKRIARHLEELGHRPKSGGTMWSTGTLSYICKKAMACG